MPSESPLSRPERNARWSLLAGATLSLFAVQALSGIMLSLYYQPSPESAYGSVSRIVGTVPFGWFVRSVHIWSSHLLIISALALILSKYFLRSYRHPPAAAWISGISLILILLAFAFTGHLLPWEVTGYYATQIGTDIVAAAPLVGSLLAGVLRGGSDFIDGRTLARIYSLHAVVLPLIGVFTAAWFAVAQFSGGPALRETPVIDRRLTFPPRGIHAQALASLAGLMALFTLTMWFPALQGPGADPLTAPPPGIRPEWYFLPVYQAIRVLPGSVGGIATEILIDLVSLAGVAALFALPWIDRGKGRLVRFIGGVFLLYAAYAILISYVGL
jgi:quinol-cytochrome oxidoreductase complex cytochrome b subunit